MSEVAVVYHSATGTTKRMAEALLASLDAADAIVFGCPTFMGGPSAQMKSFLDATVSRWYSRAWANKLAAGFTISSTPSGDKLQTLTALAVTAMQHGMIWVGVDQMPLNPEQLNRLSVYLGAAGQADYTTTPPGVMAPDLRTGEMLGARVARLAARMRASA